MLSNIVYITFFFWKSDPEQGKYNYQRSRKLKFFFTKMSLRECYTNFLWRVLRVFLGRNFSNKSKYVKLKQNGLHRDHLPAWAIFEPASVGVKLKSIDSEKIVTFVIFDNLAMNSTMLMCFWYLHGFGLDIFLRIMNTLEEVYYIYFNAKQIICV